LEIQEENKMIDISSATLDVDVKDIRHELECALREARDITKEAKYLCYPVGEITTKLSSLADQHGLLDEMNELLDQVTEAEHNLESAFYECESVFEEAISELELEEDYD
jgi:predicted nuclease with TOPRIM domain